MAQTSKKLLLIGWAAADWKVIRPLIAKGELPMLARLLRGGVIGNLTTLEPVLSPLLWTSLATGKHAWHHGVHGFAEVEPDTGRVVPVSAATRQCRTLWEMLADHGLKSHVVGWFATHGERTPGVNVVSNLYAQASRREMPSLADWPPPPAGTYWPETLGQTLDELRLHPTELDGDVLKLFVRRAAEVDQRKDPRLYRLAECLAEAVSVQAATTWLMEHAPWNLTAVYFGAIGEICRGFMPFHPPRMDGVRERDFELYHDVVNSAYRLLDLFLTRLVALAGEGAAVVLVSDHGFHSDHLRPRQVPDAPGGIVAWPRVQGIFAAAGPGFAVGEEIHGARLLDVTPTLLRWFDLPRGRDMEGRVLREAFADTATEAEIPTWEKSISAADRAGARFYFPDVDHGGQPARSGAAAEAVRHENRWQLAQALMHGGRAEEALPLFEDVFAAQPERVDHAQRLAHCQIQLGLLEEAEATLEAALDSLGNAPGAHLIRAEIAWQRGEFEVALRHLETARAGNPDFLPLWELLGRTLLKLRRWDECEAAARKVLALDPEHALAWVGIARCQLHRGESEAAVKSALEAVSLQYSNALAHLNLGLALGQLARWEEAEHAFRNATVLQPYLIPPHRFLAHALRQLGRPAEADACLDRARGLGHVYNFQKQQQLAQRRDRMARRAAERRAKRQEAREQTPRREAGAASVPPCGHEKPASPKGNAG